MILRNSNFFNLFTILMLSALITSCDKSNPVTSNDKGINPFINDNNDRNMIVLISDIHLGADLSYAEINKNLGSLEKFLYLVKDSKNVKELVIAGDFFDEWFVPPSVNTYNGKDQSDFVLRIALANKGVIDAFNSIIQAGEIIVTYVPGNHDLTITKENVDLILPGIHQARDSQQGLGTYTPADLPILAVEHGHRYNFLCAPDPISNKDIARGSIMPPGYFITRIATQFVIQNCTTAGDTIPLVTPNNTGDESQYLTYLYWRSWKTVLITYPVLNKFNEKMIVTNINGFTANYSINDLLPYQLISGSTIDVNLFKGIQDTWKERQILNKVGVEIPTAQALAKAGSTTETDNQAVMQYFMNPFNQKRIVVFGHTHAAKINVCQNYKGIKTIYANTGTWIDHNLQGPTTNNFVVITLQNSNVSTQTHVKLYNYQNEIVTKMAEDSLRY